MRGLLLALLLAIPATAQEWNNSCFHGLNDADSPAVLSNCESPDLLNVEANLSGSAILKRKGFSNTASLTITTAPVTGSHSFIDSAGNRLDIVCQDRNCAKSTNGNAFSTFLTTAASGITRWSFVDQGGILYGANDRRDPIMRYDGTTRSSPVGMPLGSILELTQDRLAIGDISGQPNRVHFSSAGAYEQFTVGVNPEDSFFDDVGAAGDRIRGIKCVQGSCFIFKTASITLYEMGDQYTTQGSVISPSIGTTDPASIVAAGSDLYFRAQDKNFWRIGRSGLEQISKKIPNLVKSQSGGLGGGENTNTQTTPADWVAGDQEPNGSWNTATTPGSIFPSSATLVDTSSSDFAGGTLTNVSTSVGSVMLSSSVVRDEWTSGGTAGRLAWAVTAGGYNMTTISGNSYLTGYGGTGSDLVNSIYTTSATISTGSWRFDWIYEYAGAGSYQICSALSLGSCFDLRFMQNDGGDYYHLKVVEEDVNQTSAYKTVSLMKMVGGVDTALTTASRYLPRSTQYGFEIVRSTDGRFALYQDSVIISSTVVGDVSITSSTKMTILATHYSNVYAIQNGFDNFYSYQYARTGSITSRIFDAAISTPIWGPLSSTFTANNAGLEGNIAFYTQSSAAGDGTGFGSIVSSSDTLTLGAIGNKRYIRYRADFSTNVSTKSPSLDAISLTAATTGQFTTQCIEPNSSISAWGTLSCAQTLAGAGSLVYYATSAVSCAALPVSTAPVNMFGTAQAGWTAQTNNATVTIATNTAVFIGWRSLLGSSTDQAQVDACVLSWNEGTPAQPSWAAYDSRKQAIYWTSTVDGAAATNRLLKYDLNLGEWFPWNIAAQAPRVINNELYFGGAGAGTWNKYGGVDSDAGASINAYWTGKDVGSDRPFQGKDFKTLSVLNRNQGSGTLTGTWTNSIGNTGNYTISLSTGSGISYARSNFNLPKKSPQAFMKIRLGNDSSTPFEVLGIGLTWQVLPWRVEP